MSDLNVKSIKKDVDLFKVRMWNSESNKELLQLVTELRLNLAPCTVYGLDRLGFNYLEIINLASCAGKRIHTLPPSDVDFINTLESRFGIVFGFNQKVSNKYINAKVDHYCGLFTMEGIPQFISSIFTLDRLYSKKK